MTDIPPVVQEKKVNQSRFWGMFSFITIGFSFVVIGMFIFWSVYPYDVLQVKNVPLPVHPVQVRATEYVFLVTDFCKTTSHRGNVTMYLVLETKEVVLPSFSDISKARCEIVDFPVRIPKELEKGRAYVRFVIEYRVNPIRTETEIFSSQSFEILP